MILAIFYSDFWGFFKKIKKFQKILKKVLTNKKLYDIIISVASEIALHMEA